MDSDSSGAESSSSSDTLLVKKQRLQASGSLVKKVLTMATAGSSDACEACEAAIRPEQPPVVCAGPCGRKFHSECLRGETIAKGWTCVDCKSGMHRCFACDPHLGLAPMQLVPSTDATTVACRAAGCGRFYHLACVKKLSLTRVLDDNGFICPLHTCAKCEGSNPAALHAIQCLRCPTAYHTSCFPSSGVQRVQGTTRVVCLAHLQPPDDARRPRMSVSSVESANEAYSDASEAEWPKARGDDRKAKKADRKKKKKKKLKKERKRKAGDGDSASESKAEAEISLPPSTEPLADAKPVETKPKVQLNITIPEATAVAPSEDTSVALTGRDKKKKKKKRPSSTRQVQVDEAFVEDLDDHEAKWVQCDSCRKWRTVPQELDLDAMPEKWYCKMNHWAKAFASCDVPEEVVEPKKKKQKMDAPEAATPPTTAYIPATASLEKDKKAAKKEQRAKVAVKEVKWVQCDNVNCGKWRVVSQAIDEASLPSKWFCHLNTWAPELAYCHAENPPEIESVFNKKAVKAKRPKDATRSPRPAPPVVAEVPKPPELPEDVTTPAAPTPPAAAGAKAALGDKKQKVKKAVLEWAQCEKCNKWRKLPHHVKSSTLPDKWYCSMNHWNIALASCSVPEEADNDPFLDHVPDPRQGWYGSVSGRTKRGKLSYRELLYAGNGHMRKAYTEESSTLSFEFEGKTYYRDDQYRNSSMYQPRQPPEFPDAKAPPPLAPELPVLPPEEAAACQAHILRVLDDLRTARSTLDIVLALNSEGADTVFSYPAVQACLAQMLAAGLIESAAEDAIVKVTMPVQISTYAHAYYVTGENNHDVRSWDERRPAAAIKYRRKLLSRPPLKLAKPWKQRGFAGFGT
ncbi:hypothetical protein ACHHYP_13676 [Achlya hypogyna]|uniref:CW-type domain-containing protein n=1 Tax=Achlya hypogyna TaxID=1202772 RepID=A0A1V9YEV7_ACHHY|nr:hypothetical protein ACHHYP_13676 [Achlya hypogyna]